ncbi:MAG: coproporphyrinogen dehydrogenase HemZ, partial [Anaerotruncus sp.]|nr:coproporphyrinogen dehydrogenase HemZ [Anaerotruncus sp.]
MIVVVNNHPFSYDVENLAEIFFPYEKIKVLSQLPQDCNDNIVAVTEICGDEIIVDARVFEKKAVKKEKINQDSDCQNIMSVLFYSAFSELLGVSYPWGILYGVRPARFWHSISDKYSKEQARQIFAQKYLVSPEKLSLVEQVAENENKIISLSANKSFSLYVSVPFCPTRCSYCSFVSHSIEKAAALVEPYVDLLVREIEQTAIYAKELGLRLESVYYGGGTPTTLSAKQLTRIAAAIRDNFDLSCLREYTVEAGRPDTVNADKLAALKAAGVGRISINPQSFNDNVLSAIGRRHSVKQTLDAFELARNAGFDNINMDFIAGLPKDDVESFKHSIKTAVSLGAESITVHTLCLKSGAYMVTRDNVFDTGDIDTVSEMVDFSREYLSAAGYVPYYMYRQGKSLGNLENVGWSKPGSECLYNVFMMDETHSVFAVGAGAVTRLKNPLSGKIERIYNYKYPYEYIDGFDNMLKRKEKITSFYKDFINK